MGTRAVLDEKIKIDDKLASQIHGIISSDSDSDFGRDFDDDYNALKPPPLDYESIRHMIVKISRPKVVNIWEERSKSVQTSNEEVIQAGVTVVAKKKKKKTKSKKADQVTSIGVEPWPTEVKEEQIENLQSFKKKKEKHLNSWATLFSGSHVKDETKMKKKKFIPIDINFINEVYPESIEKIPELEVCQKRNSGAWTLLENEFPDLSHKCAINRRISATSVDNDKPTDMEAKYVPSDIDFLNDGNVENVEKMVDMNKPEEKIIDQPLGYNFLNESYVENFWNSTEWDRSYQFPHGNEIKSFTSNYRIGIKDIMGGLSENTDEDDTNILKELQTAKSVEILTDNQENANSIFLNKNVSVATDHIPELNPVDEMASDVTSVTNKKTRRRKKKKETKMGKKKFVPINMNFIKEVYPESIGNNFNTEESEKDSTETWTLLEDEFPDLNEEWSKNKRISATSVDNDKPIDMEEKNAPSDIDFLNDGYAENVEKRADTNELEEKIIEAEDTNFSLWDCEKFLETNKSEEKIMEIEDNNLANKKPQPLDPDLSILDYEESVLVDPYITPTEVKRIGLCGTLKEKYPSVNYDLGTRIYEPLGFNFLNKSWHNTVRNEPNEFLLKSTMSDHETNLAKDKKIFQPLDTSISFNEGHIVRVENKAKEKVIQTEVTQTDDVLDKERKLESVDIHESTSSPTKQPKKKSKKKSKLSVAESLAGNVVDTSDSLGGITGDILQSADEDHTKILEEVHADKSVEILADNQENSNSIFSNKTVEDALENKIQSSVNFPMTTENIPELNPVDVTSTADKKTRHRKRKKASKKQITEPIGQNLSNESFDIENKSDVDRHDDVKEDEKKLYSNLSNDEYMSLVTEDINTEIQSVANIEVSDENPQYAMQNLMETNSVGPITEKTETKKKRWKKKKRFTTHLDAVGLDVAATAEKKLKDGIEREGRREENPIYVHEEFHIINEVLKFTTAIYNAQDRMPMKFKHSFKQVLGTAMQNINQLPVSCDSNWQDFSHNFLCETYKQELDLEDTKEADMSQLTHGKPKAKRKRKKKSKHSPSIESHDEIEKNIPINEKIEEILTQPQETKVSDLRGNISPLANLKTTYGVCSNQPVLLNNSKYIFSTVLKNCIHYIDHSNTDIVINLNIYMLYEELYRAYIACIQKNNKNQNVFANQPCKNWQVKEEILNVFFIQEDFNANHCVDDTLKICNFLISINPLKFPLRNCQMALRQRLKRSSMSPKLDFQLLPKRDNSNGNHTIYCAITIYSGTLHHLEATKEEIRYIYWKFVSPTTSLTDNTVNIIAVRKNKAKRSDKYCANATSTIFKGNKILTLPTKKLYDKEFPSLDIYRNSYVQDHKMNITAVPTYSRDTNKRKKKFVSLSEYSTDKSKDTLTKTDTHISNVENRVNGVFRKAIMSGSDTKIQSSIFSTVPKYIPKHDLADTKESSVALKAKEETGNSEKIRKNSTNKILGAASLYKPYQDGMEKKDRFRTRVRKQSKDNFEEQRITQEKFQKTSKTKEISNEKNISLVATPSENLVSSEKSDESFEDFVKFFNESATILEDCKRTSKMIHEEYKENVTKKDFEELLKKFCDVNNRALTIVRNCEQKCSLINEQIKESEKVCDKADKPIIIKSSPKKRWVERKVGLCYRLGRSNGAVKSYIPPEEDNLTVSSDRLYSRDCGDDKRNVATYTDQNMGAAAPSNITHNKTETNDTPTCLVVPSQRNVKSPSELAQRREHLSTGPVKKRKVSFKPLVTSSKTTDVTKHFSEKNSNIAKLERFYAGAGFDGPFQRMVARKRRSTPGRAKTDMTTEFFVLILITIIVIIEIAVLSHFRNLSLLENICIIFFISLLYIYRNKQRLLPVL